ncbi:hypothetical protein [Streptomyces sp. RKAG337]|uniref:hypothetical protein n=1 Tax=Streptomyces sp. RKAG337 TaxID=2893404 RepID=UPI0020338BD0|nr:hypothetical protein [Streptomyces sp. RKAG337]MCM2425803.1 hypothetical protein [Streptomyces sp. RKAG337]
MLERDMDIGLQDLRGFKQRVDGLLKDLDDSQAAPDKMGDGRLHQGQIGTGFAGAEELMSAYTHVHSQLELLSTTMANQIEAMSISVEIARVGYENVDIDTRNHLLNLNDVTKKYYHPELDPDAPITRKPASVAGSTPPTEDTSGGGGMG